MLKAFNVTEKMKSKLKALVELEGEDFCFHESPQLASLVACLGIHQEIGSLNDELHRHILDDLTGIPVKLSSMKSEIVTWKGRFGVRIFSDESPLLRLEHPQLIHLLQPKFSYDENQKLKQLVFFPQTIAEIVALQDIELVIVKKWALNTVFGGFDPNDSFYVTNDWEIRQNDGLKMAKLIAKKRLALFGTHDLVAHVSGVDGRAWNRLQLKAKKMIHVMSQGNQEALTHLTVPYVIGVLLDDLAQPAHYDNPDRIRTMEQLLSLQGWIVKNIPAQKGFKRFPEAFSSLIEEPRSFEFSFERLKRLVKKLSLEIQIYGHENVS